MSILGDVLAKIVVGLLQFLAARHDLRQSVIREIETQNAKAALEALGWKLAHTPDLSGPAEHAFGMLDSADHIRKRGLPTHDP